ncbi:MAG: ion transporter [Rhodospirillales bacterium]|nr:ion transporter [Rhodospirillales bacterium]
MQKSLAASKTLTRLSEKLGQFVESRPVQNFIIVLIILNAVTLGLETDPDVVRRLGTALHIFDKVILAVFAFEIFSKLIYRRLAFFKNGWNIFDFIIVGIALIPSSGPLSVLRTLRIFRAMRLLSIVPSMRKVTQALFSAIPGILSVGSMILLIFYVSAVLSTNFFGDEFAPWFGTIGRSMFTLFQIMTLESWSMGIVRPVMEDFSWAWAFFVPFILVTSFAVLNLFIGIIVDAMQTQNAAINKDLKEDASEALGGDIRRDLIDLKKEVQVMSALLKAKNSQDS